MGRLKPRRARPATGRTGEIEPTRRVRSSVCRRPRRDRRRAPGTRSLAAPAGGDAVRLARLPARAARVGERRRRRPAGRRTSSLLERAGELVAACPLYLKDHSYGEYVFDWAWADAYRRHGLDYYPKLARRGAVHAGARAAPAGANARASAAAAARHRAARALGQAVVGAPALPRRRRPGGGARGRLVDAQHGPVPLEQPRARRRMPTSPTSSPACSARSARRSSRSGAASPTPASRSRSRAATRSAPPTGTSSTAATPSPTARTTRRPT